VRLGALAACVNSTTDPNTSLVNIRQPLADKSNGISASHEFEMTIDNRTGPGFIRGGLHPTEDSGPYFWLSLALVDIHDPFDPRSAVAARVWLC
jgi:hypothetical protein